MNRLTLSDALKGNRLSEFILQEEARIGSADALEFNAAIKAAVTPPRSEGQTSHLPSPDGSPGK